MYTRFLEKIKHDSLKEYDEILNNYPEASDFEKCVILLRSLKHTYGEISSKLGSPSKKSIRTALLKWAPELIEEDCNRNKLKAKEKPSTEEFKIINWLRKLASPKSFCMNKFINGEFWKFIIVEGRLYYLSSIDNYHETTPFSWWDYVCQVQITNLIKGQFNEFI